MPELTADAEISKTTVMLRTVLISILSLSIFALVAGTSMGADETQAANIVQFSDWSTILHFVEHDGNPPLIYVLLKVWSTFFGADDTSLKSCLVIIAASVAPASYFLFRRKLGEAAAIQLAVLCAFCTSFVQEGQWSRPYGIVVLLGLLANYQLTELTTHDISRKRGIAYGITMALLIYAHLSAVVVAVAHVLVMGVAFLRKEIDFNRLKSWFLSCLFALLLFLPQLIAIRSAASTSWFPWKVGIGPLVLSIVLPQFVLSTSLLQDSAISSRWDAIIIQGIFFLIFWGSLAVALLNHKWFTEQFPAFEYRAWTRLIIAMLIVEAVVASIVIRGPYVIHFLVPILLYFVLACRRLFISLPKTLAFFLPFVIVLPLWLPQLYVMAQRRESALHKIADTLNSEVAQHAPTSFLMVSREWFGPGMYRYLNKDIEFVCFPDLNKVAVIDLINISERLNDEAQYDAALAALEKKLASGSTIFHLYSPQKLSKNPRAKKDFNYMEEWRSVQIQKWLSEHARLEHTWKFHDDANYELSKFAPLAPDAH